MTSTSDPQESPAAAPQRASGGGPDAPLGGGPEAPLGGGPEAPLGGATGSVERPWRRLDPRMLLVHPVQEAIRFLPALLVLFVSGRSSQRSPWWDIAALAAVILLGMSRWFTTRYRVDYGQIELQRGLLRRQVIVTPAERVRTVDVTAPPYHRLLGLAKVEVGTAGGHGVERLVLDALAADQAG